MCLGGTGNELLIFKYDYQIQQQSTFSAKKNHERSYNDQSHCEKQNINRKSRMYHSKEEKKKKKVKLREAIK